MTETAARAASSPAIIRPRDKRPQFSPGLLADYSALPAGAVFGCLTGCHEELSRVGVSAGPEATPLTRWRAPDCVIGPGPAPVAGLPPEAGRVDRDMFSAEPSGVLT